jgi:glycosyltransferase involved in cell wall biosynthesis
VSGAETDTRAHGQAAKTADWAPRLSVVIPTRNEAGNLRPLFDELELALAGIEHQVIVVDDSSDEETRPVLRELAARTPTWSVHERPPAEQTGLATAVAQGMAVAVGAAICVMDGDLQHPPAVVPELLRRVEAGADLAVASRYAAGGAADGLSDGSRHVVSRVSTWTARVLFPEARRTTDPLTGFFCVRRDAVRGLELRPIGFKILLELLVLRSDLQVVDVPFAFAARLEGESKASVRQGWQYLKHLASLFLYVPLSSRPLKFALCTMLSFGLFECLFAGLSRTGAPLLLVWFLASGASSLANAGAQRTLTFRGWLRGSLPYRAFGAGGSAAGFGLYSGWMTVAPAHPMMAGTAAQAVALAIPLLVDLTPLHRLADRWTPWARCDDLHDLAARIKADRAWWADVSEAGAPVTPLPEGFGDLVRRSAESRCPDLLVKPPSALPQPRRNVDVLSVILLPAVRADQVAVLMRHRRTPFLLHDLQEALRWGHAHRDVAAGLGGDGA